MKTTREIGSAVQAAGGALVLALMTVGMFGTIYRFVSPDGWMVQLFQRGPWTGLAGLAAVAAIALALRAGDGRSALLRRTWLAALVMLAFAAAGAFFIARLWLRGGF